MSAEGRTITLCRSISSVRQWIFARPARPLWKHFEDWTALSWPRPIEQGARLRSVDLLRLQARRLAKGALALLLIHERLTSVRFLVLPFWSI
uniref:Uncharacterized protein n=1 Tax=Trichuris muris TaxID=70415 RepID=A0A5S6QCV9_TRIMR